MSDDTTHTVNESNEKVRLKTQIKRGSDTRDQDTHDLKVRGETPDEAAEMLSDAVRELEQRDVFERARNVGNGGNDYAPEDRLDADHHNAPKDENDDPVFEVDE